MVNNENKSNIGNTIAWIVAVAILGRVLLYVYGEVGWRFWKIVDVSRDRLGLIASELSFNLILGGAVAMVGLWAIFSSVKPRK